MDQPTCFLCNPSPALMVVSRPSAYCMVGLGPITNTYALLAAKNHVPSLADLAIVSPAAVEEIIDLRQNLEKEVGPLLMTEHGRVPVCRDDGDQHETHCYHAHALLFSSTEMDIARHAAGYYARSATFNALAPALSHSSDAESYLLISEHSSSYTVLSGRLNAPRQLARMLVSILNGRPDLADWRAAPRIAEASDMAADLRRLLEKTA